VTWQAAMPVTAWRQAPRSPAAGLQEETQAGCFRAPGVPSGACTPEETTAMQLTSKHEAYWRKNLRISAILTLIWFFVTFVIGYFARDLNFTFFGWPFSFWVGAQGALIVYLLIIVYYARYMNRLDQEHGVAEED
jgi:putative solute:sodium symporter small subunit